jgi:hypothetical protein
MGKVVKSRPKVKLVDPSKLRRLTKAETERLGFSAGAVRYVRSDLKRLTKRTVTVSRRQVQKAQQGGMSNEAYAKLNKPIVDTTRGSKLKMKGRTFYPTNEIQPDTVKNRRRYNMPITQRRFTLRLREIQKELAGYPLAEGFLRYTATDQAHVFVGELYKLSDMSFASIDRDFRLAARAYIDSTRDITQIMLTVYVD